MKNKLIKFKNYLLKLIYPNGIKCIFCGDELNQNEHNSTCVNCLESLPYIKNCCERCGVPILEGDIAVCIGCKANNYEFVKARSVFVYENKVLQAIHKFKYSGGKYLFKPLAKYLTEYYCTQDLFVDCVTCVPMFKTKEKERGYNQAKLLAVEFAKNVNLPFYELCEKVVDNSSQTSLSFKERRDNVKDNFKLDKEFKDLIKDKTILVIDDIFTTGATSNEVCKVLIEAGAKATFVLTLAHTVVNDFTDN